MNFSELRHRGGPPDGRQAAPVKVTESLPRLPTELASDIHGYSTPLLHSDRRKAWQWLALGILECGKIANDKYLGVSGMAQIRLHQHASGAIDRRTQFPA